jgi:hypothetical protein
LFLCRFVLSLELPPPVILLDAVRGPEQDVVSTIREDDDLLHAADSISYLEVNVDLLLRWLPNRTCYVGPAEARAKINDTFDRIAYPRAQELARPYYDRGLERVAEYVAQHEGPAAPTRSG